MTAVTNTSPLCYLVLTDCIEILPKLYRSIATTQTVLDELRHADAPPAVRTWALHPPDWLTIYPDPATKEPALTSLHAGERTAILLTEQLRTSTLLLDERAARTLAMERGHKVVGMLGLLADAADAGLINLDDAIARLRQTNFRASPALSRSLVSRRK